MRYVRNAWCLILLGQATACHFFDDPLTLEKLFSTDSDTERTDTGDGEAQRTCASGSGYPCPCDSALTSGTCADGSACLSLDGTENGLCTMACVDDASCASSRGFGSAVACGFTVQSEEHAYCVLACETAADCPRGLSCQPTTSQGAAFSACLPVFDADAASCASFCRRFIDCALELDAPTQLTVSSCTDSCVANDWAGDSCGGCWLTCDRSLECREYYECLDRCPCEDLGTDT
jgi:hypothetical protein